MINHARPCIVSKEAPVIHKMTVLIVNPIESFLFLKGDHVAAGAYEIGFVAGWEINFKTNDHRTSNHDKNRDDSAYFFHQDSIHLNHSQCLHHTSILKFFLVFHFKTTILTFSTPKPEKL